MRGHIVCLYYHIIYNVRSLTTTTTTTTTNDGYVTAYDPGFSERDRFAGEEMRCFLRRKIMNLVPDPVHRRSAYGRRRVEGDDAVGWAAGARAGDTCSWVAGRQWSIPRIRSSTHRASPVIVIYRS
jgi:hypothetical protein